MIDRRERMRGALLGLALGDAAGLPFEGLSRRRVARRFRGLDRFRFLGRAGFVSDDTEQTALLGQALLLGGDDDAACVRAFRRAMVGWLWRFPFGIGLGTLRACLRMSLGWACPGARSAGNGAAMRAGILGVVLADDAERRRALGRAIASLTHTDERAIQGARYVAEVAAGCARGGASRDIVERARATVDEPELTSAIELGVELADLPLERALVRLRTTGFVVHSVALCTYAFLRADTPVAGIELAIASGGDTDTHAAIVGGWLGALHGAGALPVHLVARLHDGPFGPTHLARLADALVDRAPPPRWSWLAALARNLALYPVVLAHGFARLVPW